MWLFGTPFRTLVRKLSTRCPAESSPTVSQFTASLLNSFIPLMIVPEPRNVGAKGAPRPDGPNRLEFVTFCVVLRVMEMRGNKPASVARRAGFFPVEVAMVKDERSLRTRQRPVRSGALRGAGDTVVGVEADPVVVAHRQCQR